MAATMTIPFQPGLVSGGHLSEEEYQARKRQCTEEALASLQNSAEFKEWHRRRSFKGSHPTLTALTVAATLLLAATAAAFAIWGSSVLRPGEQLPSAAELSVALDTAHLQLEQQGLEMQRRASQHAQELQLHAAQHAQELQRLVAHHAQEIQQLTEQHTWQLQRQEEEFQQRTAQQAQQHKQQLGRLQQRLEQEEAHAAALSSRAAGAEAELSRARAVNAQLQQQNKKLQAAATEPPAAPQAQGEQQAAAGAGTSEEPSGPTGLCSFSEGDDDTCPYGVSPAVEAALPHMYLLYGVAALSLLLMAAVRRLQSKSCSALSTPAMGEAEPSSSALHEEESEKFARLAQLAQEDLETMAQELEVARAEAHARAAEAEKARHALQQVQSELEQREGAAQSSASLDAEKSRQALLEVQSQLEEQREWHVAAQQLAALTSGTVPTPTCMSTGGNTPVSSSPRVGSPTKRAPLAARSRNSSSSHLAPSSRRAANDENSPAVPSPLGPGYQAAPPSIVVAAAAAASALAAKADTPRAWLDLMQVRFAALKEQAVVAEQAAAEADVALDAVRRESTTNQQKVAEMLADNELLKQRLADAKQQVEETSAKAKEAAAALQARAEEQARLQGQLAAATEQAAQLQQQLAEARQVQGASSDEERVRLLAEQLAQKEAEAAELSRAVDSLERENNSLEAQADQVTESLMFTQQHKSELEKKAAHLEQELSSLRLLAEKLEEDKAVLEEQLEESRAAHAELCAVGKQLAAAESTIHSISKRSETPDAESDLRRAISEKVAALDMLASAEKIMLEREAADGLAPLPTYSGGGRTESVMSGVSYQHDAFTPRTRGQKIANYFSTKLDKVAKLMSGDPEMRDSPVSTPAASRHSSAGGSALQGGDSSAPSLSRRPSGTMTAWFDRLNQSFTSAGKVLHQDLSSSGYEESPRISSAVTRLENSLNSVEQTQQALEYSASEVAEILAALDAAEQMEGESRQLSGAKRDLHEAHMAVQAAMREVQSCSNEIGQRKGTHHDLLQEFQRLAGQVEFASEMVDSELQLKVQMEERVAGAKDKLAAAEAELDAALQQKRAADAAVAAQSPGASSATSRASLTENVDAALLEARLAANKEYERCVKQQKAALSELQTALAGKKDAIERMAGAASRLEQAELQHEKAADELDAVEGELNELAQQHLQLMQALQAQQQRQAAALQAAVAALEQCLSPANSSQVSDAEDDDLMESVGDVALAAAQLQAGAGQLPAVRLDTKLFSAQASAGSVAGGSPMKSPAELAAELLDEGWGWSAQKSR